MARQGHPEPTGQAKVTQAYNLPCQYVLHTVGPIITGRVTPRDEALLAACYRACLEAAQERGIPSVAFCCISTGEFRFPNREAAEVAVETVRDFLNGGDRTLRVIFDVFKDRDLEIYRELLPLCDKAYVTKVDRAFDADVYFPDLDQDPQWKMTKVSEEQTYFDLEYVFAVYERTA